MKTKHILKNRNASNLDFINDNSVNLTVTSPPYPMIEMWDEIFCLMNDEIRINLENGKGPEAFELMHQEMDKVWKELYRVTSPGGIVCINIGDSTRTINKNFQIYMSSARIISYMIELGFSPLPSLIWKKTTNSPNKFMGSGMLPGGAYVTLEHEHILIFRKGPKREFKGNDLILRRESSFFWEERNVWFSDQWNIKGERQKSLQGQNRERTAAYPLELPLRLINMYSKYGDTILDPFFGTGTTSLAAMILNRNSIGIDIDASFIETFDHRLDNLIEYTNQYYDQRIKNHKQFLDDRGQEMKYFAEDINVPVMTRQEVKMKFYCIESIEKNENEYIYNLKHNQIKI